MKNERCKSWLLASALGLACGGCSSSTSTNAQVVTGGSVAAPSVAGAAVTPVAGAMMVAGSTAAAMTAGMPGAGVPARPPVAGMAGSSAAGGGGMIAAGRDATAGKAGMPAAAGAGGASGSMAVQTLPAISDYAQKGPFATTMTANTGPDNKYTIFRPEPLGANGFQHSPIIFGPGITTGPSLYRNLLDHLASHGFVTICVNSLTGGPNAAGNLEAMRTGLEWLIAQNAQAGVFQGKLAVDRAITMGYSIGATASTQLSSHAAILTTVSIHGHNTKGDPHGPIWLITGTMDVIDDNRKTLTTLEEAPAILTALPIGHLNVPAELSSGGRYIAPITAWLRYWVNADQGAKSFFLGADCKVCASPWIAPETNAQWKALMP